MTPAMWLTAAILFCSIVLLFSQKLSSDIVALCTLLALSFSGLLTPAEAFSGFSAPATIIIASVFVFGAGLRYSGVAVWLGQQLTRLVGDDERRLTVAIMFLAAMLSAFMSNIGVVAVFLPVVMKLAEKGSLRPGKVLIPLSLATVFGGMITIIGTPPNIVIAGLLEQQTGRALSTFAFLPLGLSLLLVGTVYLLLIGQKWLPFTSGIIAKPAVASTKTIEKGYGVRRLFYQVRVRSGSPLNGARLSAWQFGRQFDVTVIGVLPAGQKKAALRAAVEDLVVYANDLLILEGRPGAVAQLCATHDLEVMGRIRLGELVHLMPPEESVAEMIIPPRSQLVNKTLAALQFRERYHLNVLAVLRGPTSFYQDIGNLPLRVGDALLVQGARQNMRIAVQDGVMSLLSDLGETPGSQVTAKTWPMLTLLLFMLLLLGSGLFPTVTVMAATAVAVVLLGVLTPRQMYKAVDWGTLVLIAGFLPVGLAMQKSGLASFVGESLGVWLVKQSLQINLLAIFLMAGLLTQVIGGTTTAVLMGPIAISVAQQAGGNAAPLLVTVALATSTYFLSPYMSQTNLLIAGPGGYRSRDFLKAGLPVFLLILLVALFMVPRLWPV